MSFKDGPSGEIIHLCPDCDGASSRKREVDWSGEQYGPCTCPPYCGYSNCFRRSVGKRGFMPVCAVHKADPRKWPDGRFTGSTFVKEGGAP